jgi:hypothetical protein
MSSLPSARAVVEGRALLVISLKHVVIYYKRA